MMIYSMSDIHGHLSEFEVALSRMDWSGDNRLVLLGDYIHDGPDSYGVLDTIMRLQREHGHDKCIALMGNHEEMTIEGRASIVSDDPDDRRDGDERYLHWMKNLKLFYDVGRTIFVHAGIEEEAEDMWKLGTPENVFYEKYPATIGHFYQDLKIVAGHIATSRIAGHTHFHDIYYDGQSHYYIDGTVKISGAIPILKLDTTTDQYYQVTASGESLIRAYDPARG